MGNRKLKVTGVVVATAASATALGTFVAGPSMDAGHPATPEPLVLVDSYDEGEILVYEGAG